MNQENFASNLSGIQKVLDNQYFFWTATLFVFVFGWLARPALPSWIHNLFQYTAFRYFVLFLVVYTSTKNIQTSLLAPAVFLSIMYVMKTQSNEGFEDQEDDEEQDEDVTEDDVPETEEPEEPQPQNKTNNKNKKESFYDASCGCNY